jgi:hypothetical protein
MRRRAPDETVREYRERTTRPEGEELAGRLAAWAGEVTERVGQPWPDLPLGVADRAADVWEPLLAVADLAGGDWPATAREACTAFVTGARDDSASRGVQLLADLRGVFGDHEALSTDAVLGKLCGLDESPWGDWYGHPLSARDLAKLLKSYGVTSRQIRIGGWTGKGYRAADLREPWRRYLAGVSETTETSETYLASHVSDVSPVSDNGTRPCTVCGLPLDPVLASYGDTIHATCDSRPKRLSHTVA